MKVTALCDTGADVQLLVSYPTAVKAKSIGARITTLRQPIPLVDWKDENASQVKLKMTATFEVDGRRFVDQEFLIADTGYDVFIGQEWLAQQDVWLHPRSKSFSWPENLPNNTRFSPAVVTDPRPRKIDKKAQADAERRDRAIRCKDEDEAQSRKIRHILTNPWRHPRPSPELSEEPIYRVAAVTSRLSEDPRQQRWSELPFPTEPIPLERSDRTIGQGSKRVNWKTYTGEPIPFPPGEDPEHIRLVKDKLPERLAHLAGFFSKKNSTVLPPYRPGHDVVLELDRPLQGSPPSYRTPLQMLPLEKETTDELLAMGFIEPCMAEKPASNLFVPKPHSSERRFCQDYRWVNQFLKPRLVPAPDVPGTLSKCGKAKHFTKIDIIRAFNRLRMAVGSEYLTAFRTRQGTFQWRVLPFGLKVGPGW
jgi:hypothetical protein